MNPFPATSVDIILLPSCCSSYHWSLYFPHDEGLTLLKPSLTFMCPTCNRIYLSSRKVFQHHNYITLAINHANESLHNNKKFGFLVTVGIREESHDFLRQLTAGYISPWNHGETDCKTVLKSALTMAGLTPHPVDMSLLPCACTVHGPLFSCQKCGNDFSVVEESVSGGRVTCQRCNNSQTLPKKKVRAVVSATAEFNNAIASAFEGGLYVLSFYGHWTPYLP